MNLIQLRISNFQCFGAEPTAIAFSDSCTTIVGPNGSGKTTVLQALARMFATNPALRRVQKGDFHVPSNEENSPKERTLWIEADFSLPEANDPEGSGSTLPPCFNHMRLDDNADSPTIRFRLSASMGIDGDIEEEFSYVIGIDEDGKGKLKRVPRADRNYIAFHYLPAKRDPSDHIRSNTASLLNRILRSIDWSDESGDLSDMTSGFCDLISGNSAVGKANTVISQAWQHLHKGSHFSNASLVFDLETLEGLRKNVSINFNPAPNSQKVSYEKLSDGQKSLLFLSLVTSFISFCREALLGQDQDQKINIDKLNPPVFSIVAIEEPENSLSPHYLGRINSLIKEICSSSDAQALVTTHSPSMLSRVNPEDIRFTRLGKDRTAFVKEIKLPPQSEMDAYKFIRQGLLSNPEVYFSRLVVLGEGDSERIVLPRLFEAMGLPADEHGISIAQLGGRHVDYMWRLLADLDIPFVTLVDLDLARYQGGWGRIKVLSDHLGEISSGWKKPVSFPKWDVSSPLSFINTECDWIHILTLNSIYFSQKLDLDFSMIKAFPDVYGVSLEIPDETTYKSVLGKKHASVEWYVEDERRLFDSYHKLFKLGSKPTAHIQALSKLENAEISDKIPYPYKELIEDVRGKLSELPE